MKRIIITVMLAALAAGCTLGLPASKPLKLGPKPEQQKRTPIYKYEGWTIARASLHNHTIYSDGRYEPEDLLELAWREGIAVLAYNDHREGKIKLGKTLTIDFAGVESHGYANYFTRLAQVQERAAQQGMLVTRGIEVSSPYFYNGGKNPNLVVTDQFKHFTVYGVTDVSIFENMPARRELPNLKPEVAPGDTPIQQWLDYLNAHGAIVNAAHVEDGQDDWFLGLHILTVPPIFDLHLQGLNGFASLPSAWHERTAGPGGLWDTALNEYLLGMRDKPLWTMGDADFHGGAGSLCNSNTLLYMREFTEPEILACMKEGRMVAFMGELFQDVYVSQWSAADGAPRAPVMLGETVKVKSAPTLRFALSREVSGARTRLIRNGRVIKEWEGTTFEYQDTELQTRREPAYYRVEISGACKPRPKTEEYVPCSELFVNPIFVRWE